MFMQLDKLERAGPINADPAGEISKARAAQTIVGASNVEPLTLAEPIVEGFARSSSVLDRIGPPVANHLGQGRHIVGGSPHCGLWCGGGARHVGIVDDEMLLP